MSCDVLPGISIYQDAFSYLVESFKVSRELNVRNNIFFKNKILENNFYIILGMFQMMHLKCLGQPQNLAKTSHSILENGDGAFPRHCGVCSRPSIPIHVQMSPH